MVPYGENCTHDVECGTTKEMRFSDTAKVLCMAASADIMRCSCRHDHLIWPGTGSLYVRLRLHGDSSCEGGYVRDDYSGNLLCDADWTEANADVMCRSLGFRGARLGQLGEAPAPPDDYQCIGYRMACAGTEEGARDCRWSPIRPEDAMAPVWLNCRTEE